MGFCHSVGSEKAVQYYPYVWPLKIYFCFGPKGFMNLCVTWGGYTEHIAGNVE